VWHCWECWGSGTGSLLFLFKLCHLLVERLDLFGDLLHFGEDSGNVLAFLSVLGNQLAGAVLLGLHLVGLRAAPCAVRLSPEFHRLSCPICVTVFIAAFTISGLFLITLISSMF
jgi:hypothetical protein